MNIHLRTKLAKPKTNNPLDLFEYCVNILIQKMSFNYTRYPIRNEFMTHNQWANIVFQIANSRNMALLSIITKNFSHFLIFKEKTFKWNFDSIITDFPAFFNLAEIKTESRTISEEILLALDDEIEQSKMEKEKNSYSGGYPQKKILPNNETIYSIKLNLDYDEEPRISESTPITIKIGGIEFESTNILDYDSIESTLFFKHKQDITKYKGSVRIYIDSAWLLAKIKDRINNLNLKDTNNSLLSKLITEKWEQKQIDNNSNLSYNKLDESQLNTIKSCLNNDISLIWGPPGTGKSFTLSYILKEFYAKKERTLIVCIANVAVDSITRQFTKTIEASKLMQQVNSYRILRLGFTRDETLLSKDYLFPDNAITNGIRKKLHFLNGLLKTHLDKDIILQYKSEIQDLKTQLKKEVEKIIESATLLFSTASSFHVNDKLNELDYDNLIIDEASMMSIPHFICLTNKIKKRIIITGDFRQLPPVVLSQSAISHKWLHRDLFEFSGIKTNENSVTLKNVNQLLVQRRSHSQICNLINQPFYNGKLLSNQFNETCDLKDKIIFDKVITYYKLQTSNINTAQYSKKGSRYNTYSMEVILKLLKEIIKNYPNLSIGVICPYREQISRINHELNKYHRPSNLKTGTIHAFQGSECDIIIFDIVDTQENTIGRLYQQNIGRRLINVALSRAKHKLIVIGDIETFEKAKGSNNVDGTVKRIFEKIKSYESNTI